MSWLYRGGYIAALAAVALICFFAPQLFGVSAENFGPLKKFIWTGGLIGIVWFGHEMHYAAKKDKSA
jgi:hypothetical protein